MKSILYVGDFCIENYAYLTFIWGCKDEAVSTIS